jgi:hypothetical protein
MEYTVCSFLIAAAQSGDHTSEVIIGKTGFLAKPTRKA